MALCGPLLGGSPNRWPTQLRVLVNDIRKNGIRIYAVNYFRNIREGFYIQQETKKDEDEADQVKKIERDCNTSGLVLLEVRRY